MAPTISQLGSIYTLGIHRLFILPWSLRSSDSITGISSSCNTPPLVEPGYKYPQTVKCNRLHQKANATFQLQPKHRPFGRRNGSNSDTAVPGPALSATPVTQASAIDTPPPIYTPSIALHATPLPSGTDILIPSSHHYIGIPDSKLASIITAVLFGIILAATAASIAWSIWRRGWGGRMTFPPRWLFCGRTRKAKSGIEWKFEMAGNKGSGVDYDDKTWGTPTLGKNEWTTDINLKAEKPPRITSFYRDSLSFGDFWLPSGKRSSAPPTPTLARDSVMVRRVETRSIPLRKADSKRTLNASSVALDTIREESDEEGSDIAQALDMVLQYTDDEASVLCSSASTTDSSLSSSEEYDTLTILALQAGMESIGKRESCATLMRGRTRQGSNASTGTGATGNTTVDLDMFENNRSTSSSSTSMASFSSDLELEGNMSTEVEEAEVFQARRVQTKSMEVKGVLVSMPTMPNVMVSGPSRSNSCSTLECDVTENLGDNTWLYTGSPNSLVEGSSMASIITTESGITCTSVDLDDFPSPPTFVALPRALEC